MASCNAMPAEVVSSMVCCRGGPGVWMLVSVARELVFQRLQKITSVRRWHPSAWSPLKLSAAWCLAVAQRSFGGCGRGSRTNFSTGPNLAPRRPQHGTSRPPPASTLAILAWKMALAESTCFTSTMFCGFNPGLNKAPNMAHRRCKKPYDSLWSDVGAKLEPCWGMWKPCGSYVGRS